MTIVDKIDLDLTNSNTLKDVESVFNDIVLFNDISGAANFYQNLNIILDSYQDRDIFIDAELVRKYKSMIDVARWTAITTISIKDIPSLINTVIGELLKNEDIVLWGKLREKLRSILILEDRDELKKTVYESLLKNNTLITTAKIYLSDRKVEGTIANWLGYFNFKMGSDRVENIKFREFLSNNENVKKLTTEESDKLIRLFKFCNRLKLSSFSFEGIEDQIFVDNGREQAWIREGKITPVKVGENIEKRITDAENILREALGDDYYKFFGREADAKLGDEEAVVSEKSEITDNQKSQQLLNNYKLDTFDWEKIESASQNLNKTYNQNEKFFNQFHEAINDRDKETIVASLIVMAKKGHLDEIFERDKKILAVFKSHLVKKFSEKSGEDLETRPRDPVYLSYFLQHLLKDILKLTENESAVLAIRLLNELKRAPQETGQASEHKQYLSIAYGDLASGEFKWKSIIEKNDRLELT